MLRTCDLTGVASLLILAIATTPVAGGFVAIANHTEREIPFVVTHEAGSPAAEKLGAGVCRRVAVGRHPVLTYSSGGKEVHFRLTPYSAYVFTQDGEKITIHRVEFTGALPRADDVPEKPAPAGLPVKVGVKLFVDDAEARTRASWEKVLRARVAAAAEVFERQCGVTFEVVGAGEWASDPETRELEILHREFERKAKPETAILAIGYTSRARPEVENEVPAVLCGGPMQTHLLFAETSPRTESERIEVLVHHLGHWLGAVHLPDPNSALRPNLAERNAIAPSLDPLNLLAVGLWSDALRTGKVKGWSDLPPLTRSRLMIVYRTLRELSPDDPLVNEHLAALDRLKQPGKVEEKPPAKSRVTPLSEGTRKVVRAMAIRAADFQRLPEAERPGGDRLSIELVRTAADVALTLAEEQQVPAFLIGIGLGLDDSSVLRDNPLTRTICRDVESDEERRERLAALGTPTMRNRRDLCQHFAVSAALAELLGPAGAEAAGLAKELLDMGRASGFSFADLAADAAGVAFAIKLKADREHLKTIRAGFRVEDYVPSINGLREGLTRQRFESEYGSTDDPRFKTAVEEIRKRVAELPAYRK